MEFRGNQAQQNARQNVATNNSSNQTQSGGGTSMPGNNMQSQSSKGSGLLIAIVLIVIILLGLGGLFVWAKKSNSIQGIETNHYQAVFLTNGQVYFGKISGVQGKFIQLSSIYYLQAPQQKVQPTDGGTGQAQQAPTALSIVKLGNELHGPEDTMFISRDQILFWENLKDDGKVVQAIKNPQAQPKQ